MFAGCYPREVKTTKAGEYEMRIIAIGKRIITKIATVVSANQNITAC